MSYILSFIVSFGIAVIAGKILIPILRRLKAGQSIKTDGPTWHMTKQGTPTMGGLMFILSMGIAVLAAGWEQLAKGNYTHLVVFAFALVFGVIGFNRQECSCTNV
jgi:phospho-N-acetylmuramoyl-pentapeptide-transferase